MALMLGGVFVFADAKLTVSRHVPTRLDVWHNQIMDTFSSTQVAEIFGVTDTTIRRWTKHCNEFLSPTATPPDGTQRIYTRDDLAVFTQVANMKAEQSKVGWPTILATLANGDRGDVPENVALTFGDEDRRNALQVNALMEQVADLHDQVIRLETESKMERERRIEAETDLEKVRDELAIARFQLRTLKDRKSDK